MIVWSRASGKHEHSLLTEALCEYGVWLYLCGMMIVVVVVPVFLSLSLFLFSYQLFMQYIFRNAVDRNGKSEFKQCNLVTICCGLPAKFWIIIVLPLMVVDMHRCCEYFILIPDCFATVVRVCESLQLHSWICAIEIMHVSHSCWKNLLYQVQWRTDHVPLHACLFAEWHSRVKQRFCFRTICFIHLCTC